MRRGCLRVGRKERCVKSSIMGSAHLGWSPSPLPVARARNSGEGAHDKQAPCSFRREREACRFSGMRLVFCCWKNLEHKTIRKAPLCESSVESTLEAVSVMETALSLASTDLGWNPSFASIVAVRPCESYTNPLCLSFLI